MSTRGPDPTAIAGPPPLEAPAILEAGTTPDEWLKRGCPMTMPEIGSALMWTRVSVRVRRGHERGARVGALGRGRPGWGVPE